MHDIDNTRLELEADGFAFQQAEYEYPGPAATRGVFDEAQEMEYAAELLGVSDEAELDQFLGGLIASAGKAIGKVIKSPVGKKLGGFLKGAVKKALPAVAGVAGSIVGGPIGGMIGSKVASAAGDIFGLELEGLSPEDQEFEAARRFVRFAGEAAKHASHGNAGDPQTAARRAVTIAARQLAPGLLRAAEDATQSEVAPPREREPAGRSGRWVRQGRTIVLHNV